MSIMYVIKKGKEYLKYQCARKGWTFKVEEAFKFKGKPVNTLRKCPSGAEIVEI